MASPGAPNPNVSIPSTYPADDIILPTGCFKVGPKVRFHVTLDLGQGDKAQPTRIMIQKDESYDTFLRRLHHFFYCNSYERSLRQWEYILVNRQYEKDDPLPLTSSNTYYAMVSELLRPGSRWKYAIVRRSHSENLIVRAIAEGTFNPTPNSPIVDTTAPDISLPANPQLVDTSQPDISNVDTPSVADVSRPGACIADTPMPDAPTDQVTPDLPTFQSPSRTWAVASASAVPSSRTTSPGPPSKASTRELSTPSTPITTARGRPSLQIGSPLASTPRARDPMQPYSPLISSPLAPFTSKRDRRSTQLSSPTAPMTRVPRLSQPSPLLAPVASAQNPSLHDASPSAPQIPAIPLGPAISPAPDAPSPSVQLGPPLVPAAIARYASTHMSSQSVQLSLPISPTAGTQAPLASLPVTSNSSSPEDSRSLVNWGELSSPLAPALTVPRPPTIPSIASGSGTSPTPVPELFQRSLSLPPKSASTSAPIVQDAPTRPTLILRPRRPLWIISRQRLSSGTEYHVHWNNGRNSWESHESLYRDYPDFVDRRLEGRR